MALNKRAQWLYNLEEIRRNNPFGPIKKILDINGKLHCETGPAYVSPTIIGHYIEGRRHGVYADIWGTVIHYFRGILIPSKFALHPENLTINEIMSNSNTEVRYAGLEIYGYERMMEENEFKLLHHDKKTKAKLLQFKGTGLEEPITVVMVYNSTPEPDGNIKRYFLSVPPNMKTCAEAISWTFRKTADEYHPDIET